MPQSRRSFLTLIVVLGLAACQGSSGTNGTNGTSCTITDNHDGTATIRCTDGTSATIASGQNGTNGTSCSVRDNLNGTSTITCTNGTSAIVSNGTNGVSCIVTDNHDGTRTITCGDGSSVTVTDAVVDYTVMTPTELETANMTAVLTSVTIPADGHPVANLKISERHGWGVKGMSASIITWRFGLLKLANGVNGSANETWVSYLAANATSTAGTESATTTTLKDNGDGTYTFRFAKDITAGTTGAGTTYEADKAHRLVILIYASGNPFSAMNVVKDFVPGTNADVTNQHEKVDQSACLECHTNFRAIAGATGALGSGEFHSGSRYDVRACVACHNDQRRFTAVPGTGTTPNADDSSIAADGSWTGNMVVMNHEAILNLPVYIHKIHMGEKLTMTGGTYAGVHMPYETTYPQDIRNCVKCHRSGTNAPMADNWKTAPSRRACGACHDNVSWDSVVPPGRVAHSGGAWDDTACATCHQAGSPVGDSANVHRPVSPPNPNSIYANPTSGSSNTNAASVAATGYVPPGAKVITYDVKSVAVVSGKPQIVFRFMIADPTAVPPVAATPVVFQTFGGSVTEMIPGFVGSPSAYIAYAVPQDNVTAPADFNVTASGYLRNIWNGSATGTLTGPDGSGYYTVTLTGVTIPSSAVMVTGGLGYTYSLGSAPTFSNNTQPLTEIDLPAYPYTPNASGYGGTGGLIVPPPDIWKVATNYSGRRTIVANTKCGGCHVALGVGPDFHAGQRNDAPTCSFCHRPNQSSSGWSANSRYYIHAIHGAEKRTVAFNWHAPSATEGFYDITYPAVLNKCEMCHLAGTYDFSTTAEQSALPNMLFGTVGQGRYNKDPTTNPTGYYSISPYVTATNLVDYGYGFATSNVNATLPDGISGTQNVGGTTVNCSPAAPCICNATNPCSVTINAPYTVNNVPVTFTQKIGTVTTTCTDTTPCTCTTSQTCTGVVAACSTGTPCQAQGTTLVISPIASACAACHDSSAAVDHMQTNGASFWEPRSTALAKPQQEECMICHGPNRIAGISLVHTDRTP